MLVKLLTLALLIATVVLLMSPKARAALRQRLPTLLLWGGLAALVVLVATGRVSWIFAAVGAALALARRALPLLRFAPLLGAFRRDPAAAGSAPTPRTGAMSRDEALDVLGLSRDASREEVIAAHRRLMQRLHPDRGGTDALAARVNEAKATLLAD